MYGSALTEPDGRFDVAVQVPGLRLQDLLFDVKVPKNMLLMLLGVRPTSSS